MGTDKISANLYKILPRIIVALREGGDLGRNLYLSLTTIKIK